MFSNTTVFPISLILVLIFLLRFKKEKDRHKKLALLVFICMSVYTAINSGTQLLIKNSYVADLVSWMIIYGLSTMGVGTTAIIFGKRDWNTNSKGRTLFAFGILFIIMSVTFEIMYFKALLRVI